MSKIQILALAILSLFLSFTSAAPLSNGLRYQGHLSAEGQPANGSFDFHFSLYDAETNGNLVSGPLSFSAVSVSNGLFQATLDFGNNAFNGDERWLGVSVRTNGIGPFFILAPTQRLAAYPYSLYAPTAGTAQVAAVASLANNLAAGAHLPPNTIASSNLNLTVSLNLATANIAASGVNRFGWTNVLSKFGHNQMLGLSLVGNGWAVDSEFGGFVTNLLSYRPLAGYASTFQSLLPAPMAYNTSGGNDTALFVGGDDTNWHGYYFVLTNTGNITAPAQILSSDVCNVQYLANPGGGGFVLEIRTNGANPTIITNLDSTWRTVGSVNAANPTWQGRTFWWTNLAPSPTQLRVRATGAGRTPIVGYAQWDSSITNGVILSQYAHQDSGNFWIYTDTNRVYPIWSAWSPQLVLFTGGYDDSRFADFIGTFNLIKSGFPGSDIVDVGAHLAMSPRSTLLERQFDISAGIPFFDGQSASVAAWGSFDSGVALGLYVDSAHFTRAGYATFSDLLWSWMGLGSYSPVGPASSPSQGLTTNLPIGGMTLYVTNGLIQRVSTP